MKKLNYTKPLAEVMELTEDIITTSFSETISKTDKSIAVGDLDAYLNENGKIQLK